MDVTLVLTHRCNLDCSYCYAGDHHRGEMDEATLERALDLLYADGADSAQLSFFGGEPFLAFERMQRAVAGAQARAAAVPGRRLILQCTTNGTLLRAPEIAWVKQVGMRVTVSLDGVREAHDLGRPRAGGGSSFEQVHRGLRGLLDAGCRPDVLMVVGPATALYTFRSVTWLWDQGIERVRMNMSVRAGWRPEFRVDLRDELVALGRELLHRRLHGQRVSFEPFETATRGGTGACGGAAGAPAVARGRVVVGSSGHLYPCGPMVGEDRDGGPEAGQRIGHVSEAAEKIAAAVAAEGVSCGSGGACACAAYLETGDRQKQGPDGLWYQRLCAEIGGAVAASLAEARERRAAEGTMIVPPLPAQTTRPQAEIDRRRVLTQLAIGAGGLALAAAAGGGLIAANRLHRKRQPEVRTAGEMLADPPPPPQPPPDPPAIPAGGMPPPPPQPPPRDPHDIPPPGGMSPPPPRDPPRERVPPPRAHIEYDPKVDGEMLVAPTEPAPEEEIHVKGEMKREK